MMKIMAMKRMTRASMLGHLFFQAGAFLPLAKDPLSERRSDVVAGVCSPVSCCSSSSSLRSSRTSSGVCSEADVLLEGRDRGEREERADFCEAGRELVLVEAHGPSGVSMAEGRQRSDKESDSSVAFVEGA